MSQPESPPEELLETIREILLSKDQARFGALVQDFRAFQAQVSSQDESVVAQLSGMIGKLQVLQEFSEGGQQELHSAITFLEKRIQEDSETLLERLTPELTNLMRRTIRSSPSEMAEALGPVMGEAIRVQIRDSRKDMIEALYPIMGETVQKAIAEFTREFQQNIDARLRGSLGIRGAFRRLSARLRGVSGAELTMRDVLPFAVQEIFLIQHDSGLLLAHHSLTERAGQSDDSDLIGGMLTAIRDFVQDAFAQSQHTDATDDMDAVQFGNQRIVIESGQQAYLAVVFTGVEPAGFHAAVRTFLSELHLKFGRAFQSYSGDHATIPNLRPNLVTLAAELANTPEPTALPRSQKIILWGGGIGIFLFLVFACFYLQFTIALLPIAFPKTTPTPSATPTLTASPTATATVTSTPTATQTLAPTATFTPSSTATPTSSATPLPSATPQITAILIGNVWLHSQPDGTSRLRIAIPTGESVIVLAASGDWVFINWNVSGTVIEGWVLARWLDLSTPIPLDITTPNP